MFTSYSNPVCKLLKYKNVTCTCTIGCLRQYFCKTLHKKCILNTQPLDKIKRHKHQSGGYNQQLDIEMVTIIKVLLNEGHKVKKHLRGLCFDLIP